MSEIINRLPTHPGDVLKEELEARGITQKVFSANTGISYTMLNEILNCKRPVTSDVALIIEAALGIAQSRMRPAIKLNIDRVRKACASWLL